MDRQPNPIGMLCQWNVSSIGAGHYKAAVNSCLAVLATKVPMRKLKPRTLQRPARADKPIQGHGGRQEGS